MTPRRHTFAAVCALAAAVFAFGWEQSHRPPAHTAGSPLLYPVKDAGRGWSAPPPRSTTTAIEPLSPPAGGYTAGRLTIPAGCHAGASPDQRCTPGATDPRVTQRTVGRTICVPGWSASVRPPESVTEPLKRRLMDAYGLKGQSMRGFELDHLIPLELGGAALDTRNLWPEAHPGSFAKDGEENRLHAEVCDGTMGLRAARRAMRTWGR